MSTSVTDNNGHTATLVTNSYDGVTPTSVTGGTPTEWDPTNAGRSYTRGNPTQSIKLGTAATYRYDVTGHVVTTSDTTGSGATAAYSSTTDWQTRQTRSRQLPAPATPRTAIRSPRRRAQRFFRMGTATIPRYRL